MWTIGLAESKTETEASSAWSFWQSQKDEAMIGAWRSTYAWISLYAREPAAVEELNKTWREFWCLHAKVMGRPCYRECCNKLYPDDGRQRMGWYEG